MEISGTCIYKYFEEGFMTDGKTDGYVILQLDENILKVMCYEHDVAGLKPGDCVRVTIEPDNYNYIYLKSINYDGEQEMLKRIFKSYGDERI